MVLALAAACGPVDPIRSAIELPDLPGAGTLVLGLESRDGLRLEAFDQEGSRAVEARASELEGFGSFLVGVKTRLSSLGLEEGTLPASELYGLRLFADLQPGFSFELRSSSFVPTAEPPPALDGYRLPGPACAKIAAAWSAKRPGMVRFALPIDPDRVLVGLSDRVVVVTATGATDLEPDGLGFVGAPRSAAVFGDSLWIVDGAGRLHRGPPSLPFRGELVPSAPRAVQIGGNSSDDLFLVGAGQQTVVYAGDVSGWMPLGSVLSSSGPPIPIGPGEALLGSSEVGVVYRLDRTGVTGEPIGPTAFETVGFVPGIGAIGGTPDGTLFRREARAWRRMPGELGWWITAIAPHRGGFVLFAASGALQQYRDRLPCREYGIRGAFRNGRLAPTRGGIVAVATLSRETEILYVPLEAPAGS